MKPLCQSLCLCESSAGCLGLSEVWRVHAAAKGGGKTMWTIKES